MRVPATAMVLAAGLGTRLRPLTDVRAKPAIPVAGEPLIRRILAWLAASGVTDVVVNLHHRPETLAAVLGDGTDLGVRVRYSWEPLLLGSAGGPRLALPILGTSPFFLVNGDTLAGVDLAALAARHHEKDARVTLAVTANREPDKYGGVRVDASGWYLGVSPRGPSAAGSRHFVGVQIVDADVFADLPIDSPSSTIGGVYDALLGRSPAAIAVYDCDVEFHDIGTMADYLSTSRALDRHAGRQGRNVRVDPAAVLRDTILWDEITIGPGARLDGCIVTDGVSVPAGAVFERATLVAGPGGLRAFPMTP
jgi:mannose-1-phosphate guanylyltransferase